jgi:hypothetical protein
LSVTLEQSSAPLNVFALLAQLDNHLGRPSVDSVHYFDLGLALGVQILVDAIGIDPERHTGIRLMKLQQCVVQIWKYLKGLPIDQNGNLIGFAVLGIFR